MEDLELLHDVRVCNVALDELDVQVDIYGGTSNVCGTIRFSFDTARDAAAQARLLHRWEVDATELTFVSHGSNISLTNLTSLLDVPATAE